MIRIGNKQRLAFDLRFEPFIVIAGLYSFTALYYTRIPQLQILSFLLLIAVVLYWSYAIRHNAPLSLREYGLSANRITVNIVIAIALAIFGWFYFSLYSYLTRGQWLSLGYGGSVSALLAIIAVASAEELFFRGYVQNRQKSHLSPYKRIAIAVLAMALYKNVVHLWDGMSFVLHIELLLVGVLHNILPSIWMEWSRSLVGPWLLHVLWDLLVYAPMSTVPYWVI